MGFLIDQLEILKAIISVISYQLSVISYQLSVISGEVISYQM
ncbi:hypothetical protein [Microcystis sp. LEGE 08355]|nr:hypothetical protein [Microcystis sp. LEGE 08355]